MAEYPQIPVDVGDPLDLGAAEWEAYLSDNPEQVKADFAEARRLLDQGDTEALKRFLTRDVKERAKAAAERIRKGQEGRDG